MYQPKVSQNGIPYKAGVGAVEINIYNPAVNAAPEAQPNQQGVGYYPAPYIPLPQGKPETRNPYIVRPQLKNTRHENAQNVESQEKPKESSTQPLINEDIIRIEAGLRNDDPSPQGKDTRTAAAKELYGKLKEDLSRKNDPALINLLNLALQDKSYSVKIWPMMALELGYAQGDQLTAKILTKIRDQSNALGNESPSLSTLEAETASKILGQMSHMNTDINMSRSSPTVLLGTAGAKT